MGDTKDRNLHYDNEETPIYLSGLKKNNQQIKTKYQDMLEQYHKTLQWK